MPFTPFHFGPAYLVKSFFTRKFHFLAFVISQVLIDFETAYNIFRQNFRLHTFLHTYIGSLAVIPIGYLVLYFSSKILRGLKLPYMQKIFYEELSPKIIFISLWIGAWSHVFLDSIMHSDVRPIWPFSNRNSFNDSIDFALLHYLCIACAMIGFVWSKREDVIKGFKDLKK